jgi:hypothetical protein
MALGEMFALAADGSLLIGQPSFVFEPGDVSIMLHGDARPFRKSVSKDSMRRANVSIRPPKLASAASFLTNAAITASVGTDAAMTVPVI